MRVLLPLPDTDFDTTEVAVPWRLLKDAGHDVVFATAGGDRRPACDQRLLDGVLFGQLGAEPEPKRHYAAMLDDPAFAQPVAWGAVEVADFDGLLLPGGHAPGMRQYLGDADLQHQVAAFWKLGRPVGAICHGVLVLARTIDPDTSASVIADRHVTCLPKYMERAAYLATAWKLGRYYRTYDAYVQDEVTAALDDRSQFVRGPRELRHRGTFADDGPTFVVDDRNLVTARWPGDAYLFARRFRALLESP